MNKCDETNNSSRMWTGLVVLGIGAVFLLDNMGVDIPDWVISWHTALILIGLLVGYKRNFAGGPWMIMVAIGAFFTVEAIAHFDMSKYYFALIFILIGCYLIFKPKDEGFKEGRWRKNKFRDRFRDQFSETDTDPADMDQSKEGVKSKSFYDIDKNDILDTVNVFGGSHQNIYSKNFKGGDVTAIFGGSDINLTQADFQDTITLDVVAIFGGIKIIIPPSWEVKSEVTAIFGGIDDKRGVGQVIDGPRKIIIIKGVALFGGVDIRNF